MVDNTNYYETDDISNVIQKGWYVKTYKDNPDELYIYRPIGGGNLLFEMKVPKGSIPATIMMGYDSDFVEQEMLMIWNYDFKNKQVLSDIKSVTKYYYQIKTMV